MGFSTGFTGGVTLTLAIAYLATLQHQRNRESQALVLRAATATINKALDPHQPVTVPPSRAEQAAIDRANLIESAKDRWNAELESAVRTLQNTDWDAVRDQLEAGFVRVVWGVESAAAERVKARQEVWARQQAQIAEQARQAEKTLREQAQELVEQARSKTQEMQRTAQETVVAGVEKGKEVVGAAKMAAKKEEKKVVEKVKGKVQGGASGKNEVEKALQ